MARIFISFKAEDASEREGLEGSFRNPNNSLIHVPVSTREDKRAGGPAAIRSYLRELMRDAHVVICLIGKNTHQSAWVDYELQVANSWGIPVVALRLASGAGPVPAAIHGHPSIPRSELAEAVERAVGGGRRA